MDSQEHYVSLAAFCCCGVDMIYDKVPAKDAERLDGRKTTRIQNIVTGIRPAEDDQQNPEA